MQLIKLQDRAENINRLEYIDCLRGFAIIGVVLTHAGFAVDGVPNALARFTAFSAYGVQLFFLLSALTLCSVYSGKIFSARSFFIRRFFRIAPMFYLGAIFYRLIDGLGPSLSAPHGIGWAQILMTFLFLHGWTPDSINSVVPGGWSIADEAMFYICFPVLLLYLTSLWRTVAALITGALGAKLFLIYMNGLYPPGEGFAHIRQFVLLSFPAQLPAFLCGLVVYQITELPNKKSANRSNRNKIALGFFLATLTFLTFTAISDIRFLRNYLTVDFTFIVLVISVCWAQPHLLVNGFMSYIGRISYSIYIVHFFFIDTIGKNYFIPYLQKNGISPTQQVLILFVSCFALSILTSDITRRFIEVPMINVGKSLSRNYG